MADRATTGVAEQAVTALGVIRARYPGLPSALQRVAEQIMLNPSAASRTTIVELAERSGTSPSTVTRFCRVAGFAGYAELRLALAGETGWVGWALPPSDPFERVLGEIMAADTPAMRDTALRLGLAEASRPDALSARHPQLVVLDLLMVGVAQRTSQPITH